MAENDVDKVLKKIKKLKKDLDPERHFLASESVAYTKRKLNEILKEYK